MSAWVAVRVCRGSTTINFAPRACASSTYLNDIGWFAAALLPMIRMQSLLAMSFQWLVMAPRPKLSAKPATVEEWQRRAWCSR